MGRLTMAFILDDILLAPCTFVTLIAKTLLEHAEDELTDKSAIRQRLLDLQTRMEQGAISQEEFDKDETALMGRLNAIDKYEESRRDA
jgi:hypothetical protein